MNAFGLAPLILVFPLIGVLFNGLVGRRFVEADSEVGEKWSGWMATLMSMSSFVIVVLLFLSLIADGYHPHVVPLFDWIVIESAGFNIPWAVQVDTLSVMMLMIITGVGSLIHMYAIGYMHGDPNFSRFFTYLNLFLFFMIVLASGSTYLMLFVGWEGVGLCSFLLIGYYFTEKPNADAARKAFIANRVGDLAMILAMILTFWAFGSLGFQEVFADAVVKFDAGTMVEFAGRSFTVGQVLTAVTLLFLVGAAGKSAQVPLFIWLPDAMAGPTPVSALMHAATMVTSGIYLIVRSNVLFEIARESHVLGQAGFLGLASSDWVALIGAITALYAGLIAFTQFDIKKVLAYSTVSQLGFMIAAAGMGAYVAAMFHLMTHAFFKALLFLGSGSVIHGMEHGHHHLHDHGHGKGHGHDDSEHSPDHDDHFDPQDMRTMGGLKDQMPWTYRTYMVGALALAGIFPFAGFWSKDEILAHGYTNGEVSIVMIIVGVMLTLAAFCTAFYMARQMKMVFFGKPRHEAASHAHESAPIMLIPLVILAILAASGGLFNLPYGSEAGYKDGKKSHDYSSPIPLVEHLALEHWLEHSIASFTLTVPHGEDSHAEDTYAEDSHASEDSHGEEAHASEDSHADDGHGEESHGADVAHGGIDFADYQGLFHLPFTPTWIQIGVALGSTAFAVIAIVLAWFGVYANSPKRAEDPDPMLSVPVIGPAIWVFSGLFFNTLFMKYFLPAFDRFAEFCAKTIDWDIWHNFFHDNIIRDFFKGIASFSADLDRRGVDGIVNGVAKVTGYLAELLRQSQTGYARNYALSVLLGAVALIAYFVIMAN